MGIKVILKAHSSGHSLGKIQMEENNGFVHEQSTPEVHLIRGTLAEHFEAAGADSGISVLALLDTGADVTVMRKESRAALEQHRGADLHVERKIKLNGNLCAAYDVVYLLPGGHRCQADFGFVEAENDSFFAPADSFDLFLGQDILNQFIVTFDGPNGTVTWAIYEEENRASA